MLSMRQASSLESTERMIQICNQNPKGKSSQIIASTFATSMSNILKTNYSASNNLGRGHFPSRV